MQVDKEIIQKWIDALRSGDYNQTQYTLKDEKGYCCLGVLSESCASELLTKNSDFRIEITPRKLHWIKERLPVTDSCIPSSVIESVVGFFDIQRVLTECNDQNLYDFNKIADILEHFLMVENLERFPTLEEVEDFIEGKYSNEQSG